MSTDLSMDVYEFSERDESKNNRSSNNGKHKKRKFSESDDNVTHESKRKRGRKNKHKNMELNSPESVCNPPIKLKLVRDSNDPKKFTTIDCEVYNDKINTSQPDISNYKTIFSVKTSDGREYHVNDIVWSKIDEFPHWPSKITGLFTPDNTEQSPDLINDNAIASVEMIGYDQISNINCINISPFLIDFDLNFNPKIKKRRYIEAVNEAKQLAEEKLSENRIGGGCSSNSVHSCETFEADTSSTLPSHTFTSPESNQSNQSYHNPKPPCQMSGGPLSNQSSVVFNSEPLQSSSSLSTASNEFSNNNAINSHTSQNIHTAQQIISSPTMQYFPNSPIQNITANFFIDDPIHLASVIDSTTKQLADSGYSWDLPDLGNDLDLDDSHHIPEFSDTDDDDDECNSNKNYIKSFLNSK